MSYNSRPMNNMGENVHYKIGVDVGGTFTDVVVIAKTGEIIIAKTSTTKDIATGVLNSLSEGARKLHITLPDIFRGFLPFIGIQLLILALILLVPEITIVFL